MKIKIFCRWAFFFPRRAKHPGMNIVKQKKNKGDTEQKR